MAGMVMAEKSKNNEASCGEGEPIHKALMIDDRLHRDNSYASIFQGESKRGKNMDEKRKRRD